MNNFFLGFSAVSAQQFVGIKVPNIFFKTDKQNSDIVNFEVSINLR